MWLSSLLILSALGVITAKKPVYSSLFFLVTLLCLATTYLQLSAEFIAIMQVFVYAGAILVIFIFIMVLFQDAYLQIARVPSACFWPLMAFAGLLFTLTAIFLALKIEKAAPPTETLEAGYGSAFSLGRLLYLDFFFPFEAITVLFLIAVVGALYIGKKGDSWT